MTEPTLTEQLFKQLQGAPMQQIAQQLGTNTEQASSAVSQALPLLMGALGSQASQPQGVQNLLGSLGNQGAGGLGSMLGSLLGGGGSTTGGGLAGMLGQMLGGGASAGTAQSDNLPSGSSIDGLLGSVFGGQQARAEDGLGKASGLGSQGAHNLLVMLAPIVISFLGQRFLQHRSGQPNAQDEAALGEALTNEHQAIKQHGGASLFDPNGDGKLDMNDLVSLGSALFGGKH